MARLITNQQAREMVIRNAERAGAELMHEMLFRVISRTPVDDGTAKGNWNVGVNRTDRTYNEAAQDPSGQTALARGIEVFGKRLELGKRFFVTNSAPYILKLEFGAKPGTRGRRGGSLMVWRTIGELQKLAELVASRVRNE